MEDYSRDLEKELSKYSVPNPFKQSRNWQLLFVSDDGKTISVKRYKGLVISILVALVTAVLFSVTMTILYYQSNVEKNDLKLAAEKSKKELRKAIEERELLNAKLFFEKKESKIVSEAADKAVEEKKKIIKPAKPEKKAEPIAKKIEVGIESFTMTKDVNSNYTKIKFNIRNISKVKRISGYVFVVLKPEGGTQQDWLTLPPALLKDGEPTIYKRGRFFTINHFKSMNFKYKHNYEGEYKTATVFIYSKPADSLQESLKTVEKLYPVDIKITGKKTAIAAEKKSPVTSETNSAKALVEKKTSVSTPTKAETADNTSANKKEPGKKTETITDGTKSVVNDNKASVKKTPGEGKTENAN